MTMLIPKILMINNGNRNDKDVCQPVYRITNYKTYLEARRYRNNIRAGRKYYDDGTRPIPYPKQLL
jgi:hypothetical protein